MENIAIPSALRVINYDDFEGCGSLKKIEFLEGRQTLQQDSDIWNKIFRNSKVEEIVLPKTLKEMSPDIFKCCDSLKIVRVAKGCPINVKKFVKSGVDVQWK